MMEVSMIAKLPWAIAILALCFGLVTASPVSAQPYPQRPVKIIVAGLPGTATDLIARAIADRMSANLKQPFIVENRPGAGGNIGAEVVAKSAADGHTLLVTLGTTFTVNPSLYKKPPFDPEMDFQFISIVGKAPQILVAHASVPVNSVAEFVAYAKKGPIAYAHGGPGTPGHLCMEYFGLLAGFKTMPVPYRGNTQLSADLAGGQIKFGFVGAGGVAQHVRAGRLRGLAVSTRTRTQLAPELPTIAEAGYPDFEFETRVVLAAPAGLPDSVNARLEYEVQQALTSPDLEEKFRAQDILIDWVGSVDTKARIKADFEKWAKVVKATSMRVD
jgi:tripartite-type tricarboxylate transporter receptor subunit TctC